MSDHQDPERPSTQSAQASIVTAAPPIPRRHSELGAAALTIALGLLLIDAAVETFLSGAPVRWWVVGVVAVFLTLIAGVLWRGSANRFGWPRRVTASCFVLLGLLAWTVWLPDGLTNGVAMLRQPTSVVLSAVSALAVAAAGLVLVRVRFLPWWGRAALGLLAVYGVAAFAAGVIEAVPYPSLFQGESLWRRLPYWLQGAFIGTLVAVPLAMVAAIVDAMKRLRAADGRGWGLQQSLALGLATVMAVSGLTINGGPGEEAKLAGGQGPQGSPVSPPPPIAPAPTGATQTVQTLTDPTNLPKVLDAMGGLLAATPESVYDVSAKAEELGPGVDQVFAFVRDQVRYEVYEGALRGPRDTMTTLAGNSYDKSLLLGALLAHHGIQVRYARRRIQPDQARRLVSQMFANARGEQSCLDLTSKRPGGPEASQASRDLARATARQWLGNVELVSDALTRAGMKPSGASVTTLDGLVSEAADHVWVMYLAGDTWTALDPSVEDARIGQTFGQAEETWDSMPPTVYHRVNIRLLVERREQGRTVTTEALRFDSPASQLTDTPVALVYRATSAGLTSSSQPVLTVGQKTIVGQSVHSGGLEQGSTALGRRLFQRPGSPRQDSEMTAQWIQVEFTSPSQTTVTTRRYIFDRIGSLARHLQQQSTAPLAPLPQVDETPLYLASIYGLSFATGCTHPAVPLHWLARHSEALRSVSSVLATTPAPGQAPPTLPDATTERLTSAIVPTLPDSASALAKIVHIYSRQNLAFAARTGVWQGIRFYEGAPRLAIVSLEAKPTAGSQATGVQVRLDLRHNQMRAVSEKVSPDKVAWANSVRGVLDATIEHVLLGSFGSQEGDVLASTIGVMDRAREVGASTRVLRTAEDVSSLQAPPDATGWLHMSVRDGTLAIAPERAVTDRDGDRLAWWEVDLGSGETMGIVDTGLHQGATTYILWTIVTRAFAGSIMLGYVVFFALWIGMIVAQEQTMALLEWGLDPCSARLGRTHPACH